MGFGIEGQYGEMWVTYDPLVRYTVTITRPDSRLNTALYQTYIKDKVGMPQTPVGELIDPNVNHPVLDTEWPTKEQLQVLKPVQSTITITNVYPEAVFGNDESQLYNVRSLYDAQVAEWAAYRQWQTFNSGASIWGASIDQDIMDPTQALKEGDTVVIYPSGALATDVPSALDSLGDQGTISAGVVSAYRVSVGVDTIKPYCTLVHKSTTYMFSTWWGYYEYVSSPFAESIGVSSLLSRKFYSMAEIMGAAAAALPASDIDQFDDARIGNSADGRSLPVYAAILHMGGMYESVRNASTGPYPTTWSGGVGGWSRYLSYWKDYEAVFTQVFKKTYPSIPALFGAVILDTFDVYLSVPLFRSGYPAMSNKALQFPWDPSWKIKHQYWNLIDTVLAPGEESYWRVYSYDSWTGLFSSSRATHTLGETGSVVITYKFVRYCKARQYQYGFEYNSDVFPVDVVNQYHKNHTEEHTLGLRFSRSFELAIANIADPDHTRYEFSWRLQ